MESRTSICLSSVSYCCMLGEVHYIIQFLKNCPYSNHVKLACSQVCLPRYKEIVLIHIEVLEVLLMLHFALSTQQKESLFTLQICVVWIIKFARCLQCSSRKNYFLVCSCNYGAMAGFAWERNAFGNFAGIWGVKIFILIIFGGEKSMLL